MVRERGQRRSMRLPNWDYREPGPYAITMCTEQRLPWFGVIREGEMYLSEQGVLIRELWLDMQVEFLSVRLDAFILMPNHLHATLQLDGDNVAHNPTLGDIVQRFKSLSTIRYAAKVRDGFWEPFPTRLWQQHYYDHIVRDQRDLDRCRRYIEANPSNWPTDIDYPAVS